MAGRLDVAQTLRLGEWRQFPGFAMLQTCHRDHKLSKASSLNSDGKE